MAVTAKAYGQAMTHIVLGRLNFTSDTIKVMLCTSTYAPDQDAHTYKSDVTNEITGTGYTAGGITLTGKTTSYDAPTNTLKLGCGDTTWAGSTITARYAVFYKDTGTPSTSPLLCYWDFGTDQTSSSGPFSLTLSAGLLTLSTA